MGTVIVIIGFAVVGPAPYFGLVKGHYTMVCMGLSVSTSMDHFREIIELDESIMKSLILFFQMLGIGTAAGLVASFSGAQKAAFASAADINPAQLV